MSCVWCFLAGVEDGQTVAMTIANKQVYITFRVQKSAVFRRKGANVYSDVNVSIGQAILGGTVTAQGLHESVSITVSERLKVEHRNTLLYHRCIPSMQEFNHHDDIQYVSLFYQRLFSDSLQLPGRSCDHAAGEGHQTVQQEQLRRSLRSHQDQSSHVRMSRPKTELR